MEDALHADRGDQQGRDVGGAEEGDAEVARAGWLEHSWDYLRVSFGKSSGFLGFRGAGRLWDVTRKD